MSIIRAEVSDKTQREAATVLSEMGFTISDAVKMLLTRIAREKELPFEPLTPNAKTIKAMEAAKNGKFIGTYNLDNLFAELNADD